MGGPEEQNHGFPPKSPGPTVEVEEEEDRFEALVMDLDDLDGSWALDHISLFSHHNHENNNNNLPMSPLCISCSDQAFSPLWAFLDGNDDATHATSALPDCSGLLSALFG